MAKGVDASESRERQERNQGKDGEHRGGPKTMPCSSEKQELTAAETSKQEVRASEC